jgi:hypothetical protein
MSSYSDYRNLRIYKDFARHFATTIVSSEQLEKESDSIEIMIKQVNYWHPFPFLFSNSGGNI